MKENSETGCIFGTKIPKLVEDKEILWSPPRQVEVNPPPPPPPPPPPNDSGLNYAFPVSFSKRLMNRTTYYLSNKHPKVLLKISVIGHSLGNETLNSFWNCLLLAVGEAKFLSFLSDYQYFKQSWWMYQLRLGFIAGHFLLMTPFHLSVWKQDQQA